MRSLSLCYSRMVVCLVSSLFTLLASVVAVSQGASVHDSLEISTLIQRAQTGDAAAQFQLAQAYENGKGLSKNYAEAVRWCTKAAAQGLAACQNELGYAYVYGRGVVQDCMMGIQF